ncbi:uncharacterized protein LOC143256757 [Tachypleus tridentatus]|uniref:uncharacterized protein LOC143256757 n=1 Tax=Tachypleus tridentatus TaxID=6853 RepID=UPI003FD1796C
MRQAALSFLLAATFVIAAVKGSHDRYYSDQYWRIPHVRPYDRYYDRVYWHNRYDDRYTSSWKCLRWYGSRCYDCIDRYGYPCYDTRKYYDYYSSPCSSGGYGCYEPYYKGYRYGHYPQRYWFDRKYLEEGDKKEKETTLEQ